MSTANLAEENNALLRLLLQEVKRLSGEVESLKQTVGTSVPAEIVPQRSIEVLNTAAKQWTKAVFEDTAAWSVLAQKPGFMPPLDPEFRPFILGKRAYLQEVWTSGCEDTLHVAVERRSGLVARFTVPVVGDSHPHHLASLMYAQTFLKFVLWQRSGHRVSVHGPPVLCEALRLLFAHNERFNFAVRTMEKCYGQPFEFVVANSVAALPAENEKPEEIDDSIKGCRLGFDISKSDVMVVAAKDGQVIFTKETKWDIWHDNPQYHFNVLLQALREGAKALPKVDAIGGSAGGVLLENDCVWSDDFPNIDEDQYKKHIVPIFKHLQAQFGNVPFKVANDGDVTAVAGAQGSSVLGKRAMFGLKMSSNAGSGYVNREGELTGWINELWAAPVDFSLTAAECPSSGDRGVASMYFGRNAVVKLASAAGFDFPTSMLPQDRLVAVHKALDEGDDRAVKIFETIGVYLGYATAQYSEFYDMDQVSVGGRVAAGKAGEVILGKAREVLTSQFPELAHVQLWQADEHMKRVRLCLAAASLPKPYLSILVQTPKVIAPLDLAFSPFILGQRAYVKSVRASGSNERLRIALVRHKGLCGTDSIPVYTPTHRRFRDSKLFAEKVVKFMIWQRGGYELHLHGPKELCDHLVPLFTPGGKHDFTCGIMYRIFGKEFKVVVAESALDMPESNEVVEEVGLNADGCRLAFDLGKSDFKTVAVRDGEVVHSKETEWDITNEDPQYHYAMIKGALQEAAATLPRIDAIGGATAGCPIENECVWSDCFPNVETENYKRTIVPLFKNLAKEFGNPPLKVINDGAVTALAGVQMTGKTAMFGISMGSNQGSGYVNREGALTGWINELWAAPIDFNPNAAECPWSGEHGNGSMYFGQRAVEKLAPAAGFSFPPEMLPQHKLLEVQKAMKEGDTRAALIFETIGVYLGYTTAQYMQFYDIGSFLILGRVTSGQGGEIILTKAREVLAVEFPELAHLVFFTPSEHMKRVGQCVAAAALPRTFESLLEQHPKITPPLDKSFCPFVLGKRAYLAAVNADSASEMFHVALEGSSTVHRLAIPVFLERHPHSSDSLAYTVACVKFAIWQCGGSRLLLHGPAYVAKHVAACFVAGGACAYDVRMMERIFGVPFVCTVVEKLQELPVAKQSPVRVGTSQAGCRVAFDLSKQDVMAVAVKDGEVVFTKEVAWDITQENPTYHYTVLFELLSEAAAALPKVDSIGGSAAGVIINNDCVWSDDFPNIELEMYRKHIVPIFKRLASELGITSLTVVNDGEVTALAGVQTCGKTATLGVKMSANSGSGYVQRDGALTGWINELWATRVDWNPKAPECPATGVSGVASMYFGTRAVEKLAPSAGFQFPAATLPQHLLNEVHKALEEDDERAVRIFETIGVYVGYATAQYAEVYDIDQVLLDGDVVAGQACDIILAKARDVLAAEFPELKVSLFKLDDHMKRVRLCLATAALPIMQ